jgi:hypothetical protein
VCEFIITIDISSIYQNKLKKKKKRVGNESWVQEFTLTVTPAASYALNPKANPKRQQTTQLDNIRERTEHIRMRLFLVSTLKPVFFSHLIPKLHVNFPFLDQFNSIPFFHVFPKNSLFSTTPFFPFNTCNVI